MNLRLDDEERDVLASFERDEWQSTPDLEKELEYYRAYAAATLERDRSVSVRLAADDLQQLERQAQATGMSREALIAQIVHRYMAGELMERA
jgi:predicted DNA binding CopG/RHH family protein